MARLPSRISKASPGEYIRTRGAQSPGNRRLAEKADVVHLVRSGFIRCPFLMTNFVRKRESRTCAIRSSPSRDRPKAPQKSSLGPPAKHIHNCSGFAPKMPTCIVELLVLRRHDATPVIWIFGLSFFAPYVFDRNRRNSRNSRMSKGSACYGAP